eukprot:2529678-Rhodomonas_salina.1
MCIKLTVKRLCRGADGEGVALHHRRRPQGLVAAALPPFMDAVLLFCGQCCCLWTVGRALSASDAVHRGLCASDSTVFNLTHLELAT